MLTRARQPWPSDRCFRGYYYYKAAVSRNNGHVGDVTNAFTTNVRINLYIAVSQSHGQIYSCSVQHPYLISSPSTAVGATRQAFRTMFLFPVYGPCRPKAFCETLSSPRLDVVDPSLPLSVSSMSSIRCVLHNCVGEASQRRDMAKPLQLASSHHSQKICSCWPMDCSMRLRPSWLVMWSFFGMRKLYR